ncbi:MAG TPA: class I SAM-dependent methyltransferase, partial [Candidatus Acidoferrales bacterium]|nr:class I SAM-dependent methyltransferase [Candidatus Acidoferrales bacterium]
MNFPKAQKYDKQFVNSNLMGPNALKMVEELTAKLNLHTGMRVLDLGCGKGLTSIFLAKEFGVQVFATDLWIGATENYGRFKQLGLDNQVIPLH